MMNSKLIKKKLYVFICMRMRINRFQMMRILSLEVMLHMFMKFKIIHFKLSRNMMFILVLIFGRETLLASTLILAFICIFNKQFILIMVLIIFILHLNRHFSFQFFLLFLNYISFFIYLFITAALNMTLPLKRNHFLLYSQSFSLRSLLIFLKLKNSCFFKSLLLDDFIFISSLSLSVLDIYS